MKGSKAGERGERGQSVSGQEAMILAHREAAHRIGRGLIQRWGIELTPDERDSLIDLALCEAAAGYKPERGASLTTWFFYVLQGELKKARADRRDPGVRGPTSMAITDTGYEGESEMPVVQIASTGPSPEREVHCGELRQICQRALDQIGELERTILVEIILGEEKVARLARRLGYSRGHLSLLKSSGARRLRGLLGDSAAELLREEGKRVYPIGRAA